VCDGGIVIDLSAMKGIQIDQQALTMRAEPGLLWGEVDAATQAHGLATPGGIVTHTGIAGLTVGGGLGWLMRKHGLSCDNLRSAVLVTVGGSVAVAVVVRLAVAEVVATGEAFSVRVGTAVAIGKAVPGRGARGTTPSSGSPVTMTGVTCNPRASAVASVIMSAFTGANWVLSPGPPP
jgi:FAD/FMN-containing dehydrogenase